MEAVWGLLGSGTIAMATIENLELPHISSLMARYKDRPVDFANAALVYLASRGFISAIFTVDQDDFETYRIDGKRRFHSLPAERP